MTDSGGSGRKKPGSLIALWLFITSPFILFLGGILASLVVGQYFYEKGKSDAVEIAKEDGRQEGLAQGFADARKAFEADLPKLIEDRYPGSLERERSLGFAEGREKGREEGRAIGRDAGLIQGRSEAQADAYDRGYADGKTAGDADGFARGEKAGYVAGELQGRRDAAAEFTLQRHAERNWQAYAVAVIRLAEWADRLESEPGDRELEAQLRSEARALVEAANILQTEYATQAAAFNSIVDDLEAALAANNFPALRQNARALRSALEVKQATFLQANQRIVQAFESLRR